MKKFIAFLAIALGIGVMAPTTSEARDHHRHGGHHHHYRHHHGGGHGYSPGYRQRVFVGYDYYGRPIYNYRTVGHPYRGGRYYHQPRHRHHPHHHAGFRPGFFFRFGR